MKKSTFVKIHIVMAQIFPLLPLVEMTVFHSAWSGIIAFLSVCTLVMYKCQYCSTPIWDERIVGYWLPVNPNAVDKCGVCGNPMFEDVENPLPPPPPTEE